MNPSYLPPIAPRPSPRAALRFCHLPFDLVVGNVAFDGIVAEQLGKVAFGEYRVEQVCPVVFFDILAPGLDLAHCPFKLHDFLDRQQLLVTLGGSEIDTPIWWRDLEQGISMFRSTRVTSGMNCLPCNRAIAFEQVDAPIDGTQVHAKGPGQAFLADPTIDGAADHVVS